MIAEWIANQITEACGWEQAPCYLIRDRDGAYGETFTRRLQSVGIRDRPTSPRSPWQNGYAERLIGSIRRECIDHIIVFGERHLRHVLLSYVKYYNEIRTHLSLDKDAPASRAIERTGYILCRPILGGLHHQYSRILFTIGTSRTAQIRETYCGLQSFAYLSALLASTFSTISVWNLPSARFATSVK